PHAQPQQMTGAGLHFRRADGHCGSVWLEARQRIREVFPAMRDVNGLDRREFLKAGVLAAGAGSLVGAAASAAPAAAKAIEAAGPLPTRPLGKTGHTLPILGHGGSALMAREYAYYGLTEVPDREDRVKMIRDAYEKGIRYFDTA